MKRTTAKRGPGRPRKTFKASPTPKPKPTPKSEGKAPMKTEKTNPPKRAYNKLPKTDVITHDAITIRLPAVDDFLLQKSGTSFITVTVPIVIIQKGRLTQAFINKSEPCYCNHEETQVPFNIKNIKVKATLKPRDKFIPKKGRDLVKARMANAVLGAAKSFAQKTFRRTERLLTDLLNKELRKSRKKAYTIGGLSKEDYDKKNKKD